MQTVENCLYGASVCSLIRMLLLSITTPHCDEHICNLNHLCSILSSFDYHFTQSLKFRLWKIVMIYEQISMKLISVLIDKSDFRLILKCRINLFTASHSIFTILIYISIFWSSLMTETWHVPNLHCTVRGQCKALMDKERYIIIDVTHHKAKFGFVFCYCL